MASSLVGLAAIAYGTDALGDGEKGVHIRVYYMSEYRPPQDTVCLLKSLTDMDTGKVEELANDGNWHKGDMHISDTNLSTRLAAVAYYSDKQTQIRVYYQGRDMTLKEHCHNNKGWFSGQLAPRYNFIRLVLIEIRRRRARLWDGGGSEFPQRCRLQ